MSVNLILHRKKMHGLKNWSPPGIEPGSMALITARPRRPYSGFGIPKFNNPTNQPFNPIVRIPFLRQGVMNNNQPHASAGSHNEIQVSVLWEGLPTYMHSSIYISILFYNMDFFFFFFFFWSDKDSWTLFSCEVILKSAAVDNGWCRECGWIVKCSDWLAVRCQCIFRGFYHCCMLFPQIQTRSHRWRSRPPHQCT